jgi:hypothetical protein
MNGTRRKRDTVLRFDVGDLARGQDRLQGGRPQVKRLDHRDDAVPNPRPGHVRVHESSPSDGDDAGPRHRLSRGTIQRGIKMIKRQMFGRASLPLLLLD